MQTEGLVESKGGVTFHSWSLQTGPIVEQTAGIWDDIESDVAKGETDVAAGRLRRHMEYVAGELADQLGARPPFRGDFSYDLGDLLPAVIGRHGELLKLAEKAANTWNDEDGKAKVVALKTARAEALPAYDRRSMWSSIRPSISTSGRISRRLNFRRSLRHSRACLRGCGVRHASRGSTPRPGRAIWRA